MAAEQTSRQSEQRLVSRRNPQQSLRYLLYEPDAPGKDIPKPRRPLMLFLHGAGERGGDLSAVKRHGPPKIVESIENIETDAEFPFVPFPFITVSPQCPAGRWWVEPEMLALLDELLQEVIGRHPVDEDRVYLTGISMGGFGSWRLASDHPEKFAAVVPVCGGGEPERARRLVHLPIWAFHGERDTIVPPEYSLEMVEAVCRAGGRDVKLTIYRGIGHDSWTATYENPELYQWLLEQRRRNH